VTRYAKVERAALADTLAAVGPDAATLCEGWATRDLVAHLLVRERDPLSAAGILLKPLAGHLERRQKSIAARDYATLLDQLRHPPVWSPTSNPLVDEAVNTLEMFVHHEDVRRAQPGWRPRAIDPGLSEALWTTVRRTSRLALRRFPAAVVIEKAEPGATGGGRASTGGGRASPGGDRVSAGTGGTEVCLRGRPAELAMFLTGRQSVADVTLAGPDDLIDRLRTAKLGV
jgi:uncharacterized protein (TIGR03085 family)